MLNTSKPHYPLLDGLRGVAALLVVLYHVGEGFCTSPIDQMLNHGYLAVDFFFVLSGFVIGYAYDDRWQGGLSTKQFFIRRLIRLHPMVIAGALIGAAAFLLAGSKRWDGSEVGTAAVLLATLLNLFLIPLLPGRHDVRGNGELFPLNGPNWSLFFEYIGNIAYALLLRHIPTRALKWLVGALGVMLAAFLLADGSGFYHLGVGWTFEGWNFPGGLLRMFFSYAMGMLLSRTFRPRRVRGAFWLCSLALLLLFAVPHAQWLGLPGPLNALYDLLCVVVVFPALVVLAASGTTTDRFSRRTCTFMGDISYPLYMVHYPLMYMLYAYVWDGGLSFSQAWPCAAGVVVGSVLLAYLSLKLIDEPVRRALARRLL